MTLKSLAAAAALALIAGSASAQDYGRPPYGYAGYGYDGYAGGDCGGFTIAGARAGVTVLGFDLGAGARFGVGGGCAAAPAYAPAPVYAPPPPAYAPTAYAAPAYAPPIYAPPVYAPPVYAYAAAPPCGCVVSYAQPW